MSIFVTKNHSLTLINVLTKTLTMIITLTLLSLVTIMLSKSASATSKEYEIYKKIKPNMTVTEVAKLIYGKTYKKHLKKEYSVTTFSKRPFSIETFQKQISIMKLASMLTKKRVKVCTLIKYI